MNNQIKKLVTFVGAVLVCVGAMTAPSVLAAEKSSVKSAHVQQIPAQVNINKASAKEISQVLKGVGLKKAEAIVAYRKANGKFRKIEDLAQVKGIGKATVNKNRSKLVL